MALLTLDVPIVVEVQENGKTKSKLKVTYRYATKEEEREFKDFNDKMLSLYKRLKKFESKINTFDKKIEYAEKAEDYKKAEKLLDEKLKIEDEADNLIEEFESNGGENFREELSKKMFDLLVGGEDKEKLREIAEKVGFAKIIETLAKERDNIEKKQNGE